MTTHNYHMMPDDTPIPPEGMKCMVWNRGMTENEVVTIIARIPATSNSEYRFVDSDLRCWMNAEVIRAPEYVPLTVDDYSGEIIRREDGKGGIWRPIYWDTDAVVIDKGIYPSSIIGWKHLHEAFQYKKDGVWHPMRKAKT